MMSSGMGKRFVGYLDFLNILKQHHTLIDADEQSNGEVKNKMGVINFEDFFKVEKISNAYDVFVCKKCEYRFQETLPGVKELNERKMLEHINEFHENDTLDAESSVEKSTGLVAKPMWL